MRKKFTVILFILINIGLCGCNDAPQPIMLKKQQYDFTNKYDTEKLKQLSEQSAKYGWYWLLYDKKPNLKLAAEYFNACWQYDPDNYNAYWGWGVLRGEQATGLMTKDSCEKLLLQSIEFLNLALQKNIPQEEVPNLKMDLANAYNGLGAFYYSNDSPEQAKQQLINGQKILEEIINVFPDNGRAYFLSAVNAYYQNNIIKAKEYSAKAQDLEFPIDPNFLKELQ